MRRVLAVPAIAILLVGATPAPFGGWAVITVQDLPEYLVAGRSTSLTFTVRQHGLTPMNDLSPTLTLRQNGERRGGRPVPAERAAQPGQYRATVTVPDTGAVVITIDANWHAAETTLLPLRVAPAGVTVAALSAGERGRQLFVAKGCLSCHTKRDDPLVAGRGDADVGPDLTGRAFEPTWLATKLADPARNRVRTNEYAVMPNLGLAQPEIEALVRFLNAPAATDAATGTASSRSGS
jgi:mono/diheme cytochrome c family protein